MIFGFEITWESLWRFRGVSSIQLRDFGFQSFSAFVTEAGFR
jgi:hypothetical protein